MWFWVWMWIQPVSTGFRSNQSGKPLPEGGGLTGPVGIVNPGNTSSVTESLPLRKLLSNYHRLHSRLLLLESETICKNNKKQANSIFVQNRNFCWLGRIREKFNVKMMEQEALIKRTKCQKKAGRAWNVIIDSPRSLLNFLLGFSSWKRKAKKPFYGLASFIPVVLDGLQNKQKKKCRINLGLFLLDTNWPTSSGLPTVQETICID